MTILQIMHYLLTFHGHDLSISTASSTSLDAKRGTLTGLTNTRHGGFATNCSQGLGQPNCCRGLAFAQRSRINTRDDDIVALGMVGSSIPNRQGDLGLGNAPGNDFVVGQAESVDDSWNARGATVRTKSHPSPPILSNSTTRHLLFGEIWQWQEANLFYDLL